MNLFDYDKAYRESLAVFEALRKLGFSADDIYFMVAGARSHVRQTLIVLRTQGKEFSATTGFLDDPVDKVESTWTELAGLVAAGAIPQSQLDKSWQDSRVYANRVMLVAALISKGFKLPEIVANVTKEMN